MMFCWCVLFLTISVTQIKIYINADSFTFNSSNSTCSSKHRVDEQESEDIETDEIIVDKIQANQTERTGYVSQTAVALRCRVTPPPCLKNPYVMNESETATDPLGYQRSKCASFFPANIGGNGLSRYFTDFHEIQIAKALQCVHEKGIAHLDVKPDNIYIKKGVCKLGDFDCATRLDKSLPVKEGDSRYLPQEILNENYEHLDKVDIFSLAVTVYELIRYQLIGGCLVLAPVCF